MITDKELIKALFQYGHFRNPAYPYGYNVGETDLDILVLTDRVVQDAVASYQHYMGDDFDRISWRRHGQLGARNGVVDSATRDLIALPRCGRSDFESDEHGYTGQGSWPMPCQKAGVTYSLDTRRMPQSLVSRIDTVMAMVERAYAKVGLRLKRVDVSVFANIRISWKSLPGSTIGLAYYNNGSCSDVVDCFLDYTYAGLMFELIAHEMGHNCGLGHTRRQNDIMYPSVRELSVKEWLPTDSSYDTLIRFFGPPLIDEPPGPTPTTTTPKPPPVTTTPPPDTRTFWQRLRDWLFN